MAIKLKNTADIEKIRRSSLLVAKVHAAIAECIAPGVSGVELDKIAEECIRDHGGVPAFKGYNGFPNTLCISPESEVVHGIPKTDPFSEGTIVSVDCGVLLDGFYGDSAFTYPIGDIDKQRSNLLTATMESLLLGIAEAKEGNTIGDVAHAIQSHVESLGYGVVRELVGHGIGTNLHEEPNVPNYGKKGRGVKLVEGMVIAIEPMINMGGKKIVFYPDGWTVKTKDGKPSAHFEHTVAIGKEKGEILSCFVEVEKKIKIGEYING